MNQFKYGFFLGYIELALVNILGILLTPFIIKSLGIEEYGLYILVGASVAYLSLFDMGINNAIIRFVSRYREENNILAERQFLGTTVLLYCIISFLVIIVGVVISFNLNYLFDDVITDNQLSQMQIMSLILVFNIAIVLPSNIFPAICTAYEKFVFPRFIKITRIILRSLTIIAVLSYIQAAIALIIIDTAFNLLTAVVGYLYTKKKLKIKYNFSKHRLSDFKSICSYSFLILIISFTQYLQWQAGTLVVGFDQDTTQVAIYSIGIMLGSYLGAFAGIVNSMLIPKATRLVVNESAPEKLTQEITKVARLNNYISFLFLGGFIVLGQDFIQLWLGNGYDTSMTIAIIIMCAILLPLTQSLGFSILEAKKKITIRTFTSLTVISLGLLCGSLTIEKYGIIGFASSIAIAIFINALIMSILFKIIFAFNIRYFALHAFLPYLAVTTILIWLFKLLKMHYSLDCSWISLSIQIVIYTGSYLILSYLFIANREEKTHIHKHILSRS